MQKKLEKIFKKYKIYNSEIEQKIKDIIGEGQVKIIDAVEEKPIKILIISFLEKNKTKIYIKKMEI